MLRRVLPPPAAPAPGASRAGAPLLLELASGTGEHAVHFARALPHLDFQPSDPDASARASIEAWRAHARLPNLRPPLALDAHDAPWPLPDEVAARLCAVLAINLVHISPWSATLGLLDGAAARLRAGDPLLLYGPYRRGGRHTAPSNAAFDAQLRARDPRWGVRDLEAVEEAAALRGLRADEVVQMPANNLMLVLRRQPPAA